MHGNGALTAVRTSLSEQLATLRGVEVAALPESLLAIAVREVAGVHVLLPADWEALRHDEGAAGRPVPFWARPWPSGTALAQALAVDPPPARARVLELGCGLAAPSIVAARAGAVVLATDGATDAVAFAAHSLALNQVTGGQTDEYYNEALVMAATVLVVLPLVVVYGFTQRHFVESVNRTGLVD